MSESGVELSPHPHHPVVRWVFGIIFGLGALVLLANGAFAAYIEGRFYPQVNVVGTPIGGLTRDEARSKVRAAQSEQKLIISQGKSKPIQVQPHQLGAEFDLEATLDQAYLVGRTQSFALMGLLDSQAHASLRYAYKIDRQTLGSFLDTLATQAGIAPSDAAIVIAGGVPTIQPDKDGQKIDRTDLSHQLQAALSQINGQVEILPTTTKADVSTEAAKPALESTKRILATTINLTYGDKHFSPTSTVIGTWLAYDKREESPGQSTLQPRLNLELVKQYVASVAKGIDVAATTRKITSENGVSRVDVEGANGLAVDQDVVTNAINQALTTPTALVLAIPTKAVAFKTQYNQIVSLDAARYIEVNLSTQHLWAYQDKQVVYDSPVTSGATGAGYPTVTGLFSIQAKERNRYLNGRQLGYNYYVFVQYWMPFYADYGLHDASWRSSFGGPDYYYNGSHGCVNLPLATAAWLWDWDSVGTPVWVHN